MRLNRRGPLETHEVMGEDKNPTIIMFHGYGANAMDLASLAEVTPLDSEYSWIFPNGPFEVPIGPGWTGRAWWPLDLEKIAQPRDISTEVPPELPKIRKKVFDMITSLKKPWSEIILGGFSQGGMLALDVAMHAPENPKGLILLSTALINKSELSTVAAQRKGLSFYLSHGSRDPVIDIKNSQRLETFLTSNGLHGKLKTFSGMHEIPMPILNEVGQYITNLNKIT